jgi:hypothetical protein
MPKEINTKEIKLVFAPDTYNIICWCYHCDWTLFPAAWLDPNKTEQEQKMLRELYQDHHDESGECEADINCKFNKLVEESTY